MVPASQKTLNQHPAHPEPDIYELPSPNGEGKEGYCVSVCGSKQRHNQQQGSSSRNHSSSSSSRSVDSISSSTTTTTTITKTTTTTSKSRCGRDGYRYTVTIGARPFKFTSFLVRNHKTISLMSRPGCSPRLAAARQNRRAFQLAACGSGIDIEAT